MKVDVHAHLYPPRYLQAVDRITERPSNPWTQAVRRILSNKIAPNERMTGIDRRIEDMDAAGIDMQVLSLSIPHAYFDDERQATELARLTNDLLAEVKAAHPTRFRAFAVLPLPHIDAAVAELARATDELGLDGVTLGANVNGRPLDDDSFEPVYRAMSEDATVLFLHPMIPPGQEDLADYDLSSAVGFHLDTTAAVLRLVYGGVLERNAEIEVIVPHLGAFLPYVWDRVEKSFATRPEARVNIDRPPSHYLSRMYYDSVNFHPPAWSCAIETVGADHLVLGSDYPFALGGMDRAIETIERLPLSREQKERIFSGTLLRLLPDPPKAR